MNSNTLAQRLQSAEKSIVFIQREHASTLTNLHEEISKWQQKCSGEYRIEFFLCLFIHSILNSFSDLTFQLTIGGTTMINTTDDSKSYLLIKVKFSFIIQNN